MYTSSRARRLSKQLAHSRKVLYTTVRMGSKSQSPRCVYNGNNFFSLSRIISKQVVERIEDPVDSSRPATGIAQ